MASTEALSQISLKGRAELPSGSRGVAFAPTRLLKVLTRSCVENFSLLRAPAMTLFTYDGFSEAFTNARLRVRSWLDLSLVVQGKWKAVTILEQKREPRRILVQPYDFSVQSLVDQIDSGDIELNPSYQRNYVWMANDDEQNKRSRLIESLLLNIPIPVIYFAEQEETLKYEVIDGQQRLATFRHYLRDEFELKKLEIRDDLNGKKYSELTQRDRDEIRKRSIRAIVVLNDSDEQIKYEVFERLNLGSVQLTAQEIRNNTLRGDFNELLKTLASGAKFTSMLKLRLRADENNMAKEEMVLRFFAYKESNSRRTDTLSFFLTKYMKSKRNAPKEELKELERAFNNALNLVHEYLGDKAFANFGPETKKWATLTNRSLYDAEMLAFSEFPNAKPRVTPAQFVKKLTSLMCDGDFRRSLDSQAGGKMIEYRAKQIRDLLG